MLFKIYQLRTSAAIARLALVVLDDQYAYFIGTQAHPELTSRPLRPQPMFLGLVKAAMEFANANRSKATV